MGAEHNDNEIRKRKATLERLGAFRTLVEKPTGLKRRVDAINWGNKIHEVESFPREAEVIDTDSGSEWTSRTFEALCKKYDIIHILKDREDLNGLARMDNAIGELKKNIRRLQEIRGTGGGDWLQYLEKATKAYNQTANGAIQDATPDNIPANVRLELSNQAALGAEHNDD